MVQQHTASKTSNTIWTPISEECFLKAVRGVFSASRQTAGVFRVYNSRPQANQATSPALPFEIESQLTQDFAFIAAYEEGANAVSAASITPQATGRGMAINIASNSGVDAFVQTPFGEISRVLERCAQKGK